MPLLLAFASWAAAIETRDARGLNVQVEAVPAPVAIDGVPMLIHIARGSDVPVLARRIEQRWRLEGSTPRRMEDSGAWHLLGRWERGQSELIQWRGEGHDAQLIFSLLDTLRRPTPPAAGPFPLPSRCAWGRAVEDNSSLQRSGYCRVALAGLREAMRPLLTSHGWTIRHEAARSFELSREGWSGTLTLVPGRQPGYTALVWVGVRASRPVAR